tara:strand:+ start:373 stop:678 length:306 start_codon:yes stop_codon:yes gene_type:complete
VKLKHKKVVQEWYEVSLISTNRRLGEAINKFLEGAPRLSVNSDIEQEMWENNTTTLCDYEGDFDGILIYNSDDTKKLIQFICDKIGVDYEKIKDLDFKLVC